MRYCAVQLGLHAAAAVGGYVATQIGIPLPWMIGPIIVVGILSLSFGISSSPVSLRMTGQLIIGFAMGLYLDPEALARILSQAMPIAVAIVSTVAVAIGIGVVQAVLFKVQKATAVFSNVPGGPVDMAVMAQHHGGDPGRVALTQTIRIVMIVVFFPQVLLLIRGDVDVADYVPLSSIEPLPFALLTAACVVAGLAAQWVRLMNPFFMGPLLMVGVLAASGLDLPDVPDPVVALGQLLLGTSIGCMFRRDLLAGSPVFLAVALLATVILSVLCAGIGYVMAMVYDLELGTMILGVAPGSATEMSVTAKAMHLDVPLVVAFHMTRVVFIAAFLPVIFRLFMGAAVDGQSR